MRELVLVLAFVGAALLGYKLISDVPSLIHTPLMSGMNALSGITIVGRHWKQNRRIFCHRPRHDQRCGRLHGDRSHVKDVQE